MENNEIMLEENEFRLPIGYVDGEGRKHNTVKLTHMNGEAEEAMSDPKVRDNGGKLVSVLLSHVVERIGSLKKVDLNVIRQLKVADRDFILAKNRQVSFGDEVQYVGRCNHCGGKNEITINISNLPVKYAEEDSECQMTFDLIDGVEENGKVCRRITIQMPNGLVQERLAPIAKINPAQATTTMLFLITKGIEGIPVLNQQIFKKMTKRDRNLVSDKLGEMSEGIDLTITSTCSACGEEFTSSIPISILLGE